MTKPNQENCKNCSSKCAYDCAQLSFTIQHRTVLIISPLTSRQTPWLRCCLSEERDNKTTQNLVDDSIVNMWTLRLVNVSIHDKLYIEYWPVKQLPEHVLRASDDSTPCMRLLHTHTHMASANMMVWYTPAASFSCCPAAVTYNWIMHTAPSDQLRPSEFILSMNWRSSDIKYASVSWMTYIHQFIRTQNTHHIVAVTTFCVYSNCTTPRTCALEI